VSRDVSVSEHVPSEEVARVGADRKSVDVESSKMSSHGDAAELDQRRRAPADRIQKPHWHGLLAGGPRT